MEILSLNVTGASFLAKETSDHKAKLTSDHKAKLDEFKKVVKENFPILCLSGTMLLEKPGAIDGYTLVVWRPAYKRTEGSGAPSGGLAVYRNKDATCVGAPEEESWHDESRQYNDNGVCKFCRFFLPFKLTYNGEEILVCLVYFPPYDADSKKGYDIDFIHMVLDRTISTTTEVPFRVLDNVLQTFIKQTKNVIVIGDMNANTDTWNLSHKRNSKDESPIDHFGQRLLNLCRERELEILNGCTTSDSEGELTKDRHVYDYALVHTEKFPKYDFRVLDIGLDQSFFRHRPIVVKIGKYEKKDEEKDNQARAAEGDVANLAKGVEDIDLSPKERPDEE